MIDPIISFHIVYSVFNILHSHIEKIIIAEKQLYHSIYGYMYIVYTPSFCVVFFALLALSKTFTDILHYFSFSYFSYTV